MNSLSSDITQPNLQSLRDDFAKAALIGLLAKHGLYHVAGPAHSECRNAASAAYAYADAMIANRLPLPLQNHKK
jgi:hypothetical protein